MAVIPPHSPHQSLLVALAKGLNRVGDVQAVQLHQVQQGLHVESKTHTHTRLYTLSLA